MSLKSKQCELSGYKEQEQPVLTQTYQVGNLTYSLTDPSVFEHSYSTGFLGVMEMTTEKQNHKKRQTDNIAGFMDAILNGEVETIVGVGKPKKPGKQYQGLREQYDSRLLIRVDYKRRRLDEAAKRVRYRQRSSTKYNQYIDALLIESEMKCGSPLDMIVNSHLENERKKNHAASFRGDVLEEYFGLLLEEYAPEAKYSMGNKYAVHRKQTRILDGEMDCMISMPKREFVRMLDRLEEMGEIIVLNYPKQLEVDAAPVQSLEEDQEAA